MSDTAIKWDPEWCCWAASGWEDALEGSVRDARFVTRARAHTQFAAVACEPWIEVRVWKRYIRPLGRQELYEWWVESRTDEGWEGVPANATDDGVAIPGHPDEAPADWREDVTYDDESCPTWQFVHRSHPDAVPVWVCGFRNDDPPANPEAPVDPA